jgi:hypothetical protein
MEDNEIIDLIEELHDYGDMNGIELCLRAAKTIEFLLDSPEWVEEYKRNPRGRECFSSGEILNNGEI